MTVHIHQDAQDQKNPKHESEKAAALDSKVMNLHLKMMFTEQEHIDKECKINARITDHHKYTCLQSVWFTIVIIQHMTVLCLR